METPWTKHPELDPLLWILREGDGPDYMKQWYGWFLLRPREFQVEYFQAQDPIPMGWLCMVHECLFDIETDDPKTEAKDLQSLGLLEDRAGYIRYRKKENQKARAEAKALGLF